MFRPLTDHEFRINGGGWVTCSPSNTTDLGDGNYRINQGLSIAIAIGSLEVRVKAIGRNPASAILTNGTAFTASPKIIQTFFIGDSISAGIGTTGTGSSQSGDFLGANSYPVKTLGYLPGLTIDPVYRLYPGLTSLDFINEDLAHTISLFDKENHTDIYCVLFYGANDLNAFDEPTYRGYITTVCSQLRAAGAKVILVPVLSRKDSFAASNGYAIIGRRNTFNTWAFANYATIADGIADLRPYPEFFGDNAPDDATYFKVSDADGTSKVHPADAGANILALAVSAEITRLSNTASITKVLTNHATEFLTAAGISDSVIVAAINGLVADLKAAKIWTKFSCIYPFVGGTAATHKLNLREPLDIDKARRILFTGTPTHDANGITFVAGAWADTRFNQRAQNVKGISLHYYSRTASPSTAGVDIGANGGAVSRLAIKLGGSSYTELSNAGGGGNSESYTATGLFTTTRNNGTSRSLYRNGVLVRTTTEATTGFSIPNFGIGVEKSSGGTGFPSYRNCGYAAIGYGLTATEEAAHYAAVQAFQTALGRAV